MENAQFIRNHIMQLQNLQKRGQSRHPKKRPDDKTPRLSAEAAAKDIVRRFGSSLLTW